MKKIKVLMVLPGLELANGVASYAMNYFRQVDADRLQIDFVSYRPVSSPYGQEIMKEGGQVFVLPPIQQVRAHLSACYQLLTKNDYDIVHTNTLLLSFPLLAMAKAMGVPCRILHSHNAGLGNTPFKAWRNRMFLPLLRAVVNTKFACSDLAAKALFGKLDYTFIPNVIPEGKYHFNSRLRKDLRQKYQVEDKFVVATVGRVMPQKNPFYAVDLIEQLYKKIPNLVYWWIGGQATPELETYIQDKGLSQAIHFWGSRSDVADLYQAMDLFFLPSLYEGLPVVLVETQAMGLPAFVSDTVTKQVVYTDLIQYFSLEEDLEKTADLCLRFIQRCPERRPYDHELAISPFSDEKAGRELLVAYQHALAHIK